MGLLWGGIWGETLFPKALLNLFNHALSHSRHLKNLAKGWERGIGDIVRERGRSSPCKGGWVIRSRTPCIPQKDRPCPPTNLNSRWRLGRCCGCTQGCPAPCSRDEGKGGERQARSQVQGAEAFIYTWPANFLDVS